MKKLLTLVSFTVAIVQSAWGSGDYECASVHVGCRQFSMLLPDNDSLTNLEFLLMDSGNGALRFPKKIPKPQVYDGMEYPQGNAPFVTERLAPFFYDEPRDSEVTGASITDSKPQATYDFTEAVKDAQGLSVAERRELIDARTEGRLAQRVASPEALEFASYLLAASNFYDGKFDVALAHFKVLSLAHNPWVKETATYMLGRVSLNQASVSAFDNYDGPTFDKVDTPTARQAQASFDAYMAQYPKGLYIRSARGLLRRVFWLLQDEQALMAEFIWQFTHAKDPQASQDQWRLLAEFDRKTDYGNQLGKSKHPLMLAIWDLKAMRVSLPYDAEKKHRPITYQELQAQASVFKSAPKLYAYLKAVHLLLVQKNAVAALKLLPTEVSRHPLNYLDFSNAMLLGMAQENLGQWQLAKQTWEKIIPLAKLPLQRETAEYYLAMNLEQHGNIAQAFAENGQIRDPLIRQTLLDNTAPAAVLRQQVERRVSAMEQRVALFALLRGDILRGNYADFLSDLDKYRKHIARQPVTHSSDGNALTSWPFYNSNIFLWPGLSNTSFYRCPALTAIATSLAANKNHVEAQLCLGDFVRLHGLDVYMTGQITPPHGELGGAPSHFAADLFRRNEAYLRISTDAEASEEQKAYALYRAIRCYAPNATNACGGTAVPLTVRKSWFTTLKQKYKTTRWAKELEFYW